MKKHIASLHLHLYYNLHFHSASIKKEHIFELVTLSSIIKKHALRRVHAFFSVISNLSFISLRIDLVVLRFYFAGLSADATCPAAQSASATGAHSFAYSVHLPQRCSQVSGDSRSVDFAPVFLIIS